jgi:hypothetical protein
MLTVLYFLNTHIYSLDFGLREMFKGFCYDSVYNIFSIHF